MGLTNFNTDAFRNLFSFGKQRYTQTPTLIFPNRLVEGYPEFLSIDDSNAFELFRTTSQLYKVINRRGLLLATGTWKHYKEKGSGLIEVENSEYIKLLENPNPLQSGNEFMRIWNENECVFGNNYIYQLKAFSSATPSVLSHLQPTDVEIDTTGKIYKQTKIEDIIKQYRLCSNQDKFDPTEIIHTRIGTSNNPIKGESPMIRLYQEISNIRSANQMRNVILNKKGALGAISPKTNGQGSIGMGQKAKEEIERQYQDQYGINPDQLSIMLSQVPIEWINMSFPLKDSLPLEQISHDTRELIDAYGMSEHIFSRADASTFTNMAEAIKQVYQSTIIPNADEKAMTLSKAFGLVERGEYLSLDYSHIPFVQQNEKEKAEILNIKVNAINTLLQTGLYTKNDLDNIIPLL